MGIQEQAKSVIEVVVYMKFVSIPIVGLTYQAIAATVAHCFQDQWNMPSVSFNLSELSTEHILD